MGGCCNDCATDPECSIDSSVKDYENVSEPGCCEGSSCGCDDSCFDQLARVICADDDTHLHGNHNTTNTTNDDASSCCGDSDNQGSSGCTCCAHDDSPTKTKEATSPRDTASDHSASHTRVHKSPPVDTAANPKKACGAHQTIARSRYNETLAAFGCVCKALLARGFKSCCPPPGFSGKAVARSSSSRRSARLVSLRRTTCENSRPPSVHSCCGKSDCGGPALSIRSLAYRGHARGPSLKSIKSKSCASVDSCCRGDCCGDESDNQGSTENEKNEHIAIDMTEKKRNSSVQHAVLAIKGMTCTGCENKLIRTLRSIDTIHNIKTSLVLCRAEFDFDDGHTEVASLIQLIEKRSGFSAEVIQAGSTRELLLAVSRPLQDKFMATTRPVGVDAVVRSDKDTLLVIYDPRVVDARSVLESYESFSPTLAPEPPDPAITAGAKHIRSLSLRAVLSAALTIPVLVMTWAPLPAHPRAYSIACLVFATIVQVVITGPFYISSFKSLVFSRLVETELLIVLSTTAAYVYSVVAFAFDMLGRSLASGQFFETSTLLVTLIMVGQVVSAVARQRAVEAVSVRALQERTACIVFPDGTESVLDVRLLHYGDTFKVLPDSAIITDGEVVNGSSTVDESMMTGESRPVEKGRGSAVIAGTLNGPSALLIRATRLPGENTISDIARMVDDARYSRARVQEAVDWICGWFVPVVLVLALITFAVWMAVGVTVRGQARGEAALAALTYAIAVLAISCPCAIGLAVPMVILIAGGVGAKIGLVFKAATTIEQARKVTHVVLDKTGTATLGKLEVVNRFLDDGAGFDVLNAVAELVATSRHPVARAVAADLSVSVTTDAHFSVQDVEMVIGKGMQGTLLGQQLRGGSPHWLNLETHPAVQPLLAQGLTIFCVTHGSGDRLLAAFGLADTLRPEAHAVIHALAARRIQVSILSGDHPVAVFAAASVLGIPKERVRAGCSPADKQAYVRELTEGGDMVLFCGDGTNDAVALAQAAIGVHLPSAGGGVASAASAAADVVLTHPSLAGILALLELSDAVARRIALNFAWSFVYNFVAVLLAAGAFVRVRVPPAYAGVGEVVSVLPVVLVAWGLKWFRMRGGV